jgi:hypothetical protein
MSFEGGSLIEAALLSLLWVKSNLFSVHLRYELLDSIEDELVSDHAR